LRPSSYDCANQLTSVTNPVGCTRESAYDLGGRLIASIDHYGNRTSFTHNAMGWQENQRGQT
jgi:YD repeat-containing protein